MRQDPAHRGRAESAHRQQASLGPDAHQRWSHGSTREAPAWRRPEFSVPGFDHRRFPRCSEPPSFRYAWASTRVYSSWPTRTPTTQPFEVPCTGSYRPGHISDPIASTYSRLLVHEYQDCNIAQHAIVCSIAQTLPTCILGDPMQAIFGFRDPLVHWEREALAAFPPIGALQTPWRWCVAGMDALGAWLLQARASLQAGHPGPPAGGARGCPVD